MLEYIIYYYRPHKVWYGYWCNELDYDQIGEAVIAPTKDLVLIELGRVHSDRIEKYRNGD